MHYLVIHLQSQTASFRIPEFQSYHKSFRLPPPTTIIGLAGAALGLGPLASQNFFSDASYCFGVAGTHEGVATDLWKYDNFNGRGILKKEILFHNQLFIVIGHPEEKVIFNIQNAFQFPTYALSLGYSDAIVKVVKTQVITNEATARTLAFCLVKEDIIAKTINNSHSQEAFSLYIHDSMQYNIPTKFQYEKEYGLRKVMERQVFTLIGDTVTLNFDLTGIEYENRFIPVFSL